MLKIVGDKDYVADQAAANDLRMFNDEFYELRKSVLANDPRFKDPTRPDVWQEERSRRYIARFNEVHTKAKSYMPTLDELRRTHKNAVPQELWDKYVDFAKEVITRVYAASWYTGNDDDEALELALLSDNREALHEVIATEKELNKQRERS